MAGMQPCLVTAMSGGRLLHCSYRTGHQGTHYDPHADAEFTAGPTPVPSEADSGVPDVALPRFPTDTQLEAREKARKVARGWQERIAAWVFAQGERGSTVYEAWKAFQEQDNRRYDRNQIAPTFTNLSKPDKLVIFATEQRRLNHNGNREIVWVDRQFARAEARSA